MAVREVRDDGIDGSSSALAAMVEALAMGSKCLVGPLRVHVHLGAWG